MSRKVFGEIMQAYGERLGEAWPRMLLAAALALVVYGAFRAIRDVTLRAQIARLASHAAVALAVAVGLYLCVGRASCFDDAFISFRYAQNLVGGHGLVFNPGERVEGYTFAAVVVGDVVALRARGMGNLRDAARTLAPGWLAYPAPFLLILRPSTAWNAGASGSLLPASSAPSPGRPSPCKRRPRERPRGANTG